MKVLRIARSVNRLLVNYPFANARSFIDRLSHTGETQKVSIIYADNFLKPHRRKFHAGITPFSQQCQVNCL